MANAAPDHRPDERSRSSAVTISRRTVLRGSVGASAFRLTFGVRRSGAAARSQPGQIVPVSVFPPHGTVTASPETEISFRRVRIEELGTVTI